MTVGFLFTRLLPASPPQVFLKERERQHLQDLLHREVLRRIVLLQQGVRALQCRQRFLHLRQAAVTIQVGRPGLSLPRQQQSEHGGGVCTTVVPPLLFPF